MRRLLVFAAVAAAICVVLTACPGPSPSPSASPSPSGSPSPSAPPSPTSTGGQAGGQGDTAANPDKPNPICIDQLTEFGVIDGYLTIAGTDSPDAHVKCQAGITGSGWVWTAATGNVTLPSSTSDCWVTWSSGAFTERFYSSATAFDGSAICEALLLGAGLGSGGGPEN
jgi:hypothetical protein